MDELIETAELSAFARTVDAGSLSRAAAELGVPRATIGRRLARLEERLGARLLRRTTRNLVLTDEGRALYDQAKIALGAVRDAVLSVRRSDGAIRGRLRVSAPPLPGKAFHALVTGFLARHPEVRLELSFSTGAVDFGEDGFDLAIRASQTLDLGIIDASALTIPARGLANGEPGAHDERRIRTEGHPMGDKNPKQKSRQDAQKQSDKNAKAAKTKASAPVAAPKGAKK